MGTCLTSDNRVFLGADGIGIHHLKMYELLFTFGFISTTVNCNNKAEWKWLTSVKLSKCKCLLAWRHKSFFILHQPLWPLNWLLRCPSRLWVAAIQSASKLSSHLNGQVCHTLIQREQKGNYTSFFFFIVNWISRKHLPKAWSRMIKVWAGTLQWNGSKDGERALILLKLCVKGIRKQANSRTWYCESETGRG